MKGLSSPLLNRGLAKRLFATILAISTSGTAFAEQDKDVFRVCADPNNPPFSDKQGGGFENKIAELFAEKLGQTIEYTWFPQRMGFIRNTLKAKKPNSNDFKCDVVMGVPAGYELTWTTEPYYTSTYALIIPEGQGWDSIETPEDLDKLDDQKKAGLRIAMFDRGPGTEWIFKHGLIKQGVPYQTMGGDAAINTSQKIAADLRENIIDMAILWGPMAGYVATDGNTGMKLRLLPMKTAGRMKFEFPMAMGVRHGDRERKAQLNELIKSEADAIEAILKEYRVPLVNENN